VDQEKRIRLASAVDSRAVILVEGMSDQNAVRTLAQRLGRDLDTEGVSVLPMGGATTIGHFLILLGPQGRNVELAGLCDQGEESDFRYALERVGLGSDLDRDGMEQLGFFVCVEDLEDELIRALGPVTVQRIIESEGEMATFRRFQAQPAQRGRPIDRQLRRFMGTRSGRKIRYGGLLVEALDLDRVPRPLAGVLDHI
jgi:hypothetical protein